jgi:anti-sigma factor RsiW
MTAQPRDPKCREVFSLLSDYLDLELPPGTCDEISQHISGCAPCVEFVASLRKTIELCRGYRPSELPVWLRDDARKRLQEAYAKMIAERVAD